MAANVEPAITQANAANAHRRARRRQREEGQGLVELALLSPLLILLLVVAVDFGRAYSAYIQVTNAAREGAAFASRSSENANDKAAIRTAVLADTPSIYGQALNASNVDSVVNTDSYGYEQVSVTVDFQFETLVDWPGVPRRIDLERTVTMRVVGS